MRSVAFTFIFLLSQAIAIAQPCLPEGITITTQAQIDSFQINYPNCTAIAGDVFISGFDITNLHGLSLLTSIGGDLDIEYCYLLYSLTGLDSVTSIGGHLYIGFFNDALTSLMGLDNVTSIGGDLVIWGNHALTSLTGLDNIESSTIEGLYIYENSLISTCQILSICNYLTAPTGTIEIYNNTAGCNSPEEVLDSCEANAVSVEERYMLEDFSVSPNPFTTTTTLSYTLDKPSSVTISIFNPQGQLIEKIEQEQPQGEQQVQWNAEGLPAGLYIIRLQAGNNTAFSKLLFAH